MSGVKRKREDEEEAKRGHSQVATLAHQGDFKALQSIRESNHWWWDSSLIKALSLLFAKNGNVRGLKWLDKKHTIVNYKALNEASERYIFTKKVNLFIEDQMDELCQWYDTDSDTDLEELDLGN